MTSSFDRALSRAMASGDVVKANYIYDSARADSEDERIAREFYADSPESPDAWDHWMTSDPDFTDELG